MNLRKLLSCFIASVVLCLSLPCVAAGLTAEASFNPASNTVRLSGSGSGVITVIMPERDTLLSQLSDDKLPLYYKAVNCEGDFYSVTFSLPENVTGGRYIVYAVDSANTVASDSITLPAVLPNPEVLGFVNSAASPEQLCEVFMENADVLGIDASDTFITENKQKIAENLFALARSFDEIKAFYNTFYSAYALTALSGADSVGVNSILSKYCTFLGIDYAVDFKNYAFVNDNAAAVFETLLSSSDFLGLLNADTGHSFKSVFETLRFIAETKASPNWQSLKEVLTVAYPSYVKCEDNSTYAALKYPDKVFSLMFGNAFNSVEAISRSFADCTKTAYAAENPTQKNKSASGSGKGSSSVTLPIPDAATAALEATPGFSDVSEDFWAYQPVYALAKAEIVSGYPDGAFRSGSNVTRAEFVKMISVAFKLEGSSQRSPFADVNELDWFCSFVDGAYADGIIKGDENSNFCPGDNITRQDACVMLNRAISNSGVTLVGSTAAYTDTNSISSYALADIAALSSNQIVKGVTADTFEPCSYITRAQTAQLIYNALSYLKLL